MESRPQRRQAASSRLVCPPLLPLLPSPALSTLFVAQCCAARCRVQNAKMLLLRAMCCAMQGAYGEMLLRHVLCNAGSIRRSGVAPSPARLLQRLLAVPSPSSAPVCASGRLGVAAGRRSARGGAGGQL
eukprot:2506086-Rhodomonas_salina.2